VQKDENQIQQSEKEKYCIPEERAPAIYFAFSTGISEEMPIRKQLPILLKKLMQRDCHITRISSS